jgi:hypothetical protein
MPKARFRRRLYVEGSYLHTLRNPTDCTSMLGALASSSGALGIALLAQSICTSHIHLVGISRTFQVWLVGVMFATYGVVVYEAGRKSSDVLAAAILVVMVGLVPMIVSSLQNERRPMLENNTSARWTIRDAANITAFISIWTIVGIEYIWHTWSDSATLQLTGPLAATAFATTASIQLLCARVPPSTHGSDPEQRVSSVSVHIGAEPSTNNSDATFLF